MTVRSSDSARLRGLATEWWEFGGTSDAWDEIDELMERDLDVMPAMLRALVEAAPAGALPYLGLSILETITEMADGSGREDRAVDVLLEAALDRAVAFELLSGPYPDFLERWNVRERLADWFTPDQFDALFEWPSRLNQRLVLDGDGTRLEPALWLGHGVADSS